MSNEILVMMVLPWYDHEDNAQLSTMTMKGPPREITKKVAIKMIRDWYKEALGVEPPYFLPGRIWSRRFVTKPMTEATVNNILTEMAVASHNEITNTQDEGETPSGAGS